MQEMKLFLAQSADINLTADIQAGSPDYYQKSDLLQTEVGVQSNYLYKHPKCLLINHAGLVILIMVVSGETGTKR